MKWCDDCIYFRIPAGICDLGHKMSFRVPRDMQAVLMLAWGHVRKGCPDYSNETPLGEPRFPQAKSGGERGLKS